MIKLWKSSEQRGTLLVEAIAMLALIAMVTPTLYRKSAERLQEIQDINIASQMRTLDTVINSFIKSNSGSMMEFIRTNMNDENTFELCYEDSSGGDCYDEGYSTLTPFGYNPNNVKNFLDPKVYVYGKDGKLQYYIVYGKESEIGKKRAARLASLVGANGGIVQMGGLIGGSSDINISGTGNAWNLDKDMIEEIEFDSSVLTEDSIVVTSKEPIVIDQDENDVYLYRVPPAADAADDFYKNTMVTDLYMGGHSVTGSYSEVAKDYYSIFNVRKLTLNTVCANEDVTSDHYEDIVNAGECIPRRLADLYVGKPAVTFLKEPGAVIVGTGKTRYYDPNEGAAWIYGNLSALNDNFRVFRGGLTGSEDASTIVGRATGYDVMQFARLQNQTDNMAFIDYDDDSSVALQVFRATNEENSARVSMMDGLVNVVERFDNTEVVPSEVGHALAVGHSSSAGGEGSLLTAFHDSDINHVYLNSGSGSSNTWINKHGGTVYINKIEGDSSLADANTYINSAGGSLWAGVKGEWIKAYNEQGSAEVHLLGGSSVVGDARIFTVGDEEVEDEANMIYGDSSKVSLRADRVRIYNQDPNVMSSSAGGKEILGSFGDTLPAGTDLYDGATVVATQTMDVLGSTYLGSKDMSSAPDDGASYTRGKWNLGVAGSAWVDDTLWARRAWLKQGGVAELHAGFSSFDEFDEAGEPETGWLNVYNDETRGVVIRNRDAITGTGSAWTGDDLLFQAYSSGVQIWGNATGAGAGSTQTFATWDANTAMIGASDRVGGPANVFAADINAANVQGSSLVNIYTVDTSVDGVVNVQNNAMQFRGEAGSSGAYGNEILAQARWFGVTANSSFVEEADVQFRVGSSDVLADVSEVRVRNADFAVRDSSGVGKFWVRPDEDVENSSLANVNVDGSLYVTGNEIIHIASNEHNTAEKDSQRAMFEIDPNYVQVWAKTEGGSSFAGSSATDYYAMLRINPYDTAGEVSDVVDTQDASIYVRKGAIELMPSEAVGSSGVGASEGFGYIKANRLVSNAPTKLASDAGIANMPTPANRYDEYMVNPAYTSVMHDIKLTTRGGGRLSDILPDYVLKGVYNVSNDFVEGSKTQRIQWSASGQCGQNGISCTNDPVRWANAYVGKLPFAMCPPGYDVLATIMPISFMMGQAGEIIKASETGWGDPAHSANYFVNLEQRQADILQKAQEDTREIAYPGYHKVRSVNLEMLNTGGWEGGSSLPDSDWLKNITSSQIEGWFMGVPYDGEPLANLNEYDNYMSASSTTMTNVGTWLHEDVDGKKYVMAQPLYFQQNTWLKTSVDPQDGYWDAYMGFVYNNNHWLIDNGQGNEGLNSNNMNSSGATIEFQGFGVKNNYTWNLFPVPTNSIEGHATVYCYFNRANYENYKDTDGNPLVDPIDQMNDAAYRAPHDPNKGYDKGGEVSKYLDRLDDPTLKYKEPW